MGNNLGRKLHQRFGKKFGENLSNIEKKILWVQGKTSKMSAKTYKNLPDSLNNRFNN
jgi:hypothetical protein